LVEAPNRDASLLVFAQRAQARLEVEAWNQHGERFFGTRIGLAEALDLGGRIVIAPEGCEPGIRAALGRGRTDDDLVRADLAEARAGGGGLALLARRCPAVWLIERQTPTDMLALRLAAVMASVLLGPILDPASGELFGVKTARMKLDGGRLLPIRANFTR
jgi:hypothetical protein